MDNKQLKRVDGGGRGEEFPDMEEELHIWIITKKMLNYLYHESLLLRKPKPLQMICSLKILEQLKDGIYGSCNVVNFLYAAQQLLAKKNTI